MLARGTDVARWNSQQAVRVDAYVVGVTLGPPESCNCGAQDERHRDIHLELALSPTEVRGWRIVVAEVTPRWRGALLAGRWDQSFEGLRQTILGKQVRVAGWLLFDHEHARNARNTAKPGKGNARATAWEIHPVTSLELFK